jgi:DNA-binding transcriptional MerR regulator
MSVHSKSLNLIAKYLPSRQRSDAEKAQNDSEYTIEELSQLTHNTVRNIRAYQDKGILPPPKLKGRKGFYGAEHLSKLRVAADLSARGYSLASIGDLFQALEQGIGLEQLVGVESAIASPWSDEQPRELPVTELSSMFGASFTDKAIEKAQSLDLIEMDGQTIQTSSLNTLKAGAELASLGIPLEELLDVLAMIRSNVETIADNLVELVSEQVLSPYDQHSLPPKEDLPQIAELIWRLRPLAEVAVKSELSRAMEKSAKRLLADQLESILLEFEKRDKQD